MKGQLKWGRCFAFYPQKTKDKDKGVKIVGGKL